MRFIALVLSYNRADHPTTVRALRRGRAPTLKTPRGERGPEPRRQPTQTRPRLLDHRPLPPQRDLRRHQQARQLRPRLADAPPRLPAATRSRCLVARRPGPQPKPRPPRRPPVVRQLERSPRTQLHQRLDRCSPIHRGSSFHWPYSPGSCAPSLDQPPIGFQSKTYRRSSSLSRDLLGRSRARRILASLRQRFTAAARSSNQRPAAPRRLDDFRCPRRSPASPSIVSHPPNPPPFSALCSEKDSQSPASRKLADPLFPPSIFSDPRPPDRLATRLIRGAPYPFARINPPESRASPVA